MQAILLAGGFGTRLTHAIGPDVPKPMARVAGEPLLAHVLRELKAQGITEVVLCVHHLAQVIRDYAGERCESLPITYSEEITPLGTGGALLKAMRMLRPTAPVFAANADSLMTLDIAAMRAAHERAGARLSVALTHVEHCARYGEVVMGDARQITAFHYPGRAQPGWISTGAYVLSPTVFEGLILPEAFSFERAVQAPLAGTGGMIGWPEVQHFIDIGVPEDYARCQHRFAENAEFA